MKKIYILCVLLLAFILTSCSHKKENLAGLDYDFSVLSGNKAYLFKSTQQALDLVKTVDVAKDDIYFWDIYAKTIGDYFLSKTREKISKIVRLDKKDYSLAIDNPHTDSFQMFADSNGLFSVYITPNDITFEHKNIDFTVELSKKIMVEKLTLVNRMVTDQTYLYALVAIIDKKTNQNDNELW